MMFSITFAMAFLAFMYLTTLEILHRRRAHRRAANLTPSNPPEWVEVCRQHYDEPLLDRTLELDSYIDRDLRLIAALEDKTFNHHVIFLVVSMQAQGQSPFPASTLKQTISSWVKRELVPTRMRGSSMALVLAGNSPSPPTNLELLGLIDNRQRFPIVIPWVVYFDLNRRLAVAVRTYERTYAPFEALCCWLRSHGCHVIVSYAVSPTPRFAALLRDHSSLGLLVRAISSIVRFFNRK